MTPHEAQLLHALEANADAFDSYFDNSADQPPISSNRVKSQNLSLVKSKGNPTFAAQFDMSFTLNYFSVAAGVWTPLTPANLIAAAPSLAGSLPVFLFGWNDFKAGFPKMRAAYTVNTWTYGRAFLHQYDNSNDVLTSLVGGIGQFIPLDSNALAVLHAGDLVIPFTANVGGTQYVALVDINCPQVAYATLLESLVSDKFVLNMIRYIVPDATPNSLNQYTNQIGIFSQSLFGKFNSDFISPNSFKMPTQLQNNLIDIPLKRGIDKSQFIASYLNPLCVSMTWSTFVWTVSKHQA